MWVGFLGVVFGGVGLEGRWGVRGVLCDGFCYWRWRCGGGDRDRR